MNDSQPQLTGAIAFQSYDCPGVTIGYRVARVEGCAKSERHTQVLLIPKFTQ